MEFANDSGVILKRLLPKFDKCHTKFPQKLRNITDNLYYGFVNGEKYYQSMIYPIKANVRSNGNIQYPNGFNSYFFSENIRQHIHENMIYQLEYRCKIFDHEVTFRIGLLHKDELMKLDKYEQDVSFMCMWLYNCIQHTSSNTCKNLTIYFYPTKMKKRLPSIKADLISVDNVNSALTFRCTRNIGELIIYRQEEWKKVFIHETFHTFGLDIQPHIEKDIHEILKKTFDVHTIFSVSEAYTETWARILNAAYASYVSTKKNGEGLEEFAIYMNFSLQMERIFSLLQMHKVLGFLNMNYNILLEKGKEIYTKDEKIKLYKEDPNTNVFGYYILTGIMMNGYTDFIFWCNTHNFNLYKFSGTSKTNKDFVRMIVKNFRKEQCDLKSLISGGKKDKFLKTTTRMSIIELSG